MLLFSLRERTAIIAPSVRWQPEITTEIFREFEAKDVTDAVLTEAALLFSENYGVWDTPDGHPGPPRGILRSMESDHRECLAKTFF